MEVIAKRGGVLPATLESLKIGKTLGKGGFAVVKSGVLKAADGAAFPVAVKVLHAEYSDESSQELRLFRDEAELMLELDHPNIITAYGLLRLPPQFPGLDGYTQHAYALILELMEGGSLAGLMVKQLLAGTTPKYTYSQALGWVTDVAQALQHLHTGGKDGSPRIHRDVKLENVLLTAGMQTAKLADFGLQRAVFTQEGDQLTMLVRRSQRPSTSVPPPRAGPAGPSRLAAESERHSIASQRLSLGPAPAADKLAAAQPGSGPDAEDQESNALFYAVGFNGLTPLVMPSSPTAGPNSLQSQAGSVGRLRNADIARRSASMSQLDEVGEVPELRLPSAGASSPLGPALQLHQVALMPGQLLSAGSNVVSARKAQGAAPPSALRTLSPGGRLASPLGLVAPAGSPSGSRPSPLGPSSSRLRGNLGGDSMSSLRGNSFASGDGPSSKGTMPSGAPRVFSTATSKGLESPPRAERAASGSERGGRNRDSCGSPNAIGGRSTVSPGAHCSALLTSDWQQSQAATPTGGAPSASASATGMLDGGQSMASAHDVVLSDITLQPQDGRRTPPPYGVITPASPRGPRGTSMRRSAATAPGAFGASGAAADGGNAVPGSRCGLQLLALTDVDTEDQEDCPSPGSGDPARVTRGSPSQKMPPSCRKRPGSSVDCTAKVQFVEPPPSAQRAMTDTGMAGADGAGAFVYDSEKLAAQAHASAPPRKGLRTFAGQRGGLVDADGAAAASAPLQLVELLHMRLGAQNVSVRSVRSSANGAVGRPMGSAPSSPRLAAVTAAARAAGAGGVRWQADGAGACLASKGHVRSTGDLEVKPSSPSVKAPAADFEEVFSLTGRTGSLMYLAPEAYRNEPYNDKVDVYSLAILMYELFARTSITYTHISTKLPAFSRMLCNPDEYAERVAAGYRPPRTNKMAKMPPQLWQLIEEAWHQDPVQRPDIDAVVAALQELVGPLAECEAGKGQGSQLASAGCSCGCIIS